MVMFCLEQLLVFTNNTINTDLMRVGVAKIYVVVVVRVVVMDSF